MAVVFSSEFEAVRNIKPIGNNVPDYNTIAKFTYEATNGIQRLLRIFDKHQIKGTFYVGGATAEKYPQAVREIAQRGHDVAAHGYQAEPFWMMSRDEEGAFISKIVKIIESAIGKRPQGWLTPRGEPSDNTVELIAEKGFTYCWGFQDSDLPYVVNASGKKLVAVPGSMTTDDAGVIGGFVLPFSASPNDLMTMWKNEFDVLRSESEKSLRMCVMNSHVFACGRPAYAKTVDSIMDYVKNSPNVWVTTCLDLANWWLKHS
jgi:peptidoglycan/xylan/chitin deacetylase (PgdA/CDA1 family)